MIKGVLHMHTSGLAHRDLKSTNILLDHEFNIKLIDLGFAKPVGGDDGRGNMQSRVGTKDHMAPQILEGNDYRGPDVDIFALGVIFFTLMAGHPPFEMATPNDPHYKWLYYGHTASEFWRRHEGYIKTTLPNGFDEDFKNLVTLMLSYHPENRPSIVDIIGHRWM